MALSGDRNTATRPFSPPFASYKLKASTTVYAGSLVATDGNGLLVPAGATVGHTVVGRADEKITSASTGTYLCKVSQGTFKWKNSSGSPVVQGLVGKPCFVEDDETVGLSEANSVVAGIVQEIDSDGGIWVTTIGAVAPKAATSESVSTETALDPATETSFLVVSGTMAMTLAVGTVEGQRKLIRCVSAGSSPAATITFAGTKDTVAKTTMLFNAAADWVWLEWHSTGGWIVLNDNSITYG